MPQNLSQFGSEHRTAKDKHCYAAQSRIDDPGGVMRDLLFIFQFFSVKFLSSLLCCKFGQFTPFLMSVGPSGTDLSIRKHRNGINGAITNRLLPSFTLTKYIAQSVPVPASAHRHNELGQHRTIAEASAVESPIRQETIGFPAHFFARAHNFKPPGRACQPEADSPMRT